jgi:uncharacterized RDD family membrane protein YckC
VRVLGFFQVVSDRFASPAVHAAARVADALAGTILRSLGLWVVPLYIAFAIGLAVILYAEYPETMQLVVWLSVAASFAVLAVLGLMGGRR